MKQKIINRLTALINDEAGRTILKSRNIKVFFDEFEEEIRQEERTACSKRIIEYSDEEGSTLDKGTAVMLCIMS